MHEFYRFWLLKCLKLKMNSTITEEVFQIANLNYSLRTKREFKSHNVKMVSFVTEALAFFDPKIWDTVPSRQLHVKS